MMQIESVIQVVQIFFAVLIAVIPLFYPRHSLFYRRATEGLEKLREDGDFVIVGNEEFAREIARDEINEMELGIDEDQISIEEMGLGIDEDQIPELTNLRFGVLSKLSEGETGFHQIIAALKVEGTESGMFWSHIDWDDACCIRSVNGPAEIFRGGTERQDMGDLADPNSMLSVEQRDGSHKILLLNPFNPRPIKEQVYLQQWVSSRSREQALRATAILAIGYTVTSLLLV